MADYLSALPVRGNIKNDSSIAFDAENTQLLVCGFDKIDTSTGKPDVASKYAGLWTPRANDTYGLITTADVTKNATMLPISGQYELNTDGNDRETAFNSLDATCVATDLRGRLIVVGQVKSDILGSAGTAAGLVDRTSVAPLTIGGVDSTMHSRFIRTNNDGFLMVELVSGTSTTPIVDFNSSNLASGGVSPTVVLTHTPSALEYWVGVDVSGSGLMKIELQYGPTGSEVTKFVYFNSTANPWISVRFDEPIDLTSSDSMIVRCTNLEKGVSSNFEGYATYTGRTII